MQGVDLADLLRHRLGVNGLASGNATHHVDVFVDGAVPASKASFSLSGVGMLLFLSPLWVYVVAYRVGVFVLLPHVQFPAHRAGLECLRS